MKLSVIIPVYRVEDSLDRCVSSVCSQSFADLEIILVDDGSPDNCPAMCDKWAKRDNRIRVIHQPNGGLSHARNTGLKMANGECVTFVDSDDFIAPGTYQQLMPMMGRADIVEYSFIWHYGAKDQLTCLQKNTEYNDPADYWLRGHAYEHSYACNKIFRLQLFRDVTFPKGKVFEDAWTLPLLLKHARQIVTCDLGMYCYCHNQQGITAQADGYALAMLLGAHIQAMSSWCDDRYYMHVLNIQLDVTRLTGEPPQLPRRRINPFAKGLSTKQRVKAVILNLIGIKKLCTLNKHLHRTKHQ